MDHSGLCGHQRRSAALACLARPGLWRGVSVGTPGSQEPGGRRPGRRSPEGAGWWGQPRAWLGLPPGSGKAWVGAAGAAVNSTRAPVGHLQVTS